MTGTVRSEFADRRDKPRRGSTEPRDRVLREAGLIVYRRIVAGVSLVLFGVVALVAVIVTDLHDRSLPQALGAKAAVTLDFSRSSLSDEGAFAELARLSDELDLGLVKVAPDLAGNRSGQVFVTLGSASDLPSSVVRFGGQPDAQVETNAAVEHSFASGDYLVTGDHADRGSFETWLGTHHIDGRWADDGVAATLMLIVRETSFATALLTAVVLTGTLALFWLSVRARGRALRVLAGISAWRIQVEDLGGFALATLTGAVACDAIAVAIIGLDQGWVFVPYYLQVLAVFGALILGLTLMAALIMSAASWPTAEMLAARRPAAASLRGTSTVLKAGVFTLVVAAVAPAASAYTQATQAADQQATWYSLADEVALTFPSALGENGFVQIMPAVGDLVASAEADDAAALSYTWSADPSAGLDFGPEHDLALVNQTWLDLMLGGGTAADMAGFEPLPPDQVPDGVRGFLEPSMRLWSRDDQPGSGTLAQLAFYRYTGSRPIPMAAAGGGDDLRFLDTAIVAVTPNLHAVFNDNFLASLASTQNLVFAGLAPTLALVQDNGLTDKVYVRYVAEEGVLRAQYTAYFAWLRGASLAALVIALAVSATVGALITAMLKARRDFPLRLAGTSWAKILASRVSVEWLAGLAITGLVLTWQGGTFAALVALAAAIALLTSPLTHLVAARWSFTSLNLRRH